jgi:RND family efflux transporter MFP subunit
MVNKGQLLFEIDPRPFEAALKDAEADLASAEANLDLAIREYTRTANLARTGAASREEADVWKAKQAVAAANKKKSEAVIVKTNLDLEYSKITADIGGRIGKAELTEGNLVNAGGSETLLTTITSLDPIRVTFEVDERRVQERIRQRNTGEWLAKLKDAKVQIQFALDGEKEFSHAATLVFADNKINPQTGTLAAYGVAENKNGRYIDGARIRVRVPIGADANPAVLVPDTAILSDQDKRYVLIVDDENNARRRNVTLGRLDDNGMRVISPAEKLAEGEQIENWWVIEDNLQRVRLNYPVEPQKLEAAKPAVTPGT